SVRRYSCWYPASKACGGSPPARRSTARPPHGTSDQGPVPGRGTCRGDKRRVDSLLERDACRGQHSVDHLGVEDVVKRENIRFVERVDLFGNPPSCSLGHGRPPCRDRFYLRKFSAPCAHLVEFASTFG